VTGNTEFDQTEKDYDCVVKFRNGKYCLSIKELGLQVIKVDLESGYEELMRKKNQLFQENEESDEFIPLPPPRTLSVNKDAAQGQELKLFFMKTLMTGALIVAIIFFGAKKMDELARSVLDRSTHLIVATVDKTINRASDSISSSIDSTLKLPFFRAVTHGVSQKQNEQIMKDIKIIVKRNKPFVDELKLLIIDDSLTSTP
jgi:hypothetical protein